MSDQTEENKLPELDTRSVELAVNIARIMYTNQQEFEKATNRMRGKITIYIDLMVAIGWLLVSLLSVQPLWLGFIVGVGGFSTVLVLSAFIAGVYRTIKARKKKEK